MEELEQIKIDCGCWWKTSKTICRREKDAIKYVLNIRSFCLLLSAVPFQTLSFWLEFDGENVLFFDKKKKVKYIISCAVIRI